MAKARKRFFQISPSWVGGEGFSPGIEGFSYAPTLGLSFAAMEALNIRYPLSATFMFKRPNAMPSYIWSTGDAPIVTATFKEVIETKAPGEAEFRPFTMHWPDGEQVAGDWYLMNILNLIDCFDFERTGHPRPKLTTRRPFGESMTEQEIWLQARVDQAYSFQSVYIDPQPVGTLQIWRPFYQSKSAFCTGDLVKALKAAGVKRLHVDRVGTRDDPLHVYDWAALGVRPPGSPL